MLPQGGQVVMRGLGRSGAAVRWVIAALLCTAPTWPVASSLAQVAAPDAASESRATRPRPRIGLVLGGGGAKGAAHVGVLGVLEELRIPIDCIVGTSMGALIGGTFASGMDAKELEDAVRSISWQEAIARSGLRTKVPMRRKLAGSTYSNSLEFGVRDGRLVAPSGLISTQNVDLTIQYLVARSRGINDFDQLPIPFRAVATDMQTGEMAVLGKGDLALAMRASMAVPGAFAPVTIDGRILGDGGLTRNVPVDIARQTCADVVIAVAVPNPAPTAEQLRSPLTLMSRTLDVLINANERQQLETLGPDDVKIVIEMGDIGSASFERVPDAIPVGRAAALAQTAALSRYSLPEDEFLAWRKAASRTGREPMQLAAVNIVGAERVNPEFVRQTFGIEAGETVDNRRISDRATAVFALSDFERVAYTLSGDTAQPTLNLQLQEKSWGPHILRFDLGFHIGTDANTAFMVGGDYLRAWVNSRGGELHGSWRFGRTSGLEASFYQPLDAEHRWFVEPAVNGQRSIEDLFADGDAIARYRFSHAWGSIDAGRVFGRHMELRAGLRSGGQSVDREIGLPGLPEISGEGYGGLTMRYSYDSRDRSVLWQSGTLARIDYFRGVEDLGAVDSYDRLEGVAATALPFGGNVLYLRASGGASFGSDLPIYDTFTLGGPVSLPGLNLGELRGTSYWNAKATYLQRVADISYVFGQALYAGLSLSAADMSGRIDGIDSAPVYTSALLLSGRTPLGALSLSLAFTSDSEWQLMFGLGRPIEERSITDFSW
jgi:NTE family protein